MNIPLEFKKSSIILKLIILHQIKATQFYMDFVSLKRADRKKSPHFPALFKADFIFNDFQESPPLGQD